MFEITEKATRPAGHHKSCFYCGNKIGDFHKKNCVLIVKKVKIRMIVEYEVDVPNDWNKEAIEFHRNDGSWCASNAINELSKIDEAGTCLCEMAKFEYLQDTSGAYLREDS